MPEAKVVVARFDEAKAAVEAELRDISAMEARQGVHLSRSVQIYRAFLKGVMSVLEPDNDQQTADFIEGAETAKKFLNGEDGVLAGVIERRRL